MRDRGKGLKKIVGIVMVGLVLLGSLSSANAVSSKSYSATQAEAFLSKAFTNSKKFIDQKSFSLELEKLNSSEIVLSHSEVKIDNAKNTLVTSKKTDKGKVTEKTEILSNGSVYLKDPDLEFATYEEEIAKELGLDLNKEYIKVVLKESDLAEVPEQINAVRSDAKNLLPIISIKDTEKKYPKSSYRYTKTKSLEILTVKIASKTPKTRVYTIQKGIVVRMVEFDKKLNTLIRYNLRDYQGKINAPTGSVLDFNLIRENPKYKSVRDLKVATVWLEQYLKAAAANAASENSSLVKASHVAKAVEGIDSVKQYGTAIELKIESYVDGLEYVSCGYFKDDSYANLIEVKLIGCEALGYKVNTL
jgi:hypothetical protein